MTSAERTPRDNESRAATSSPTEQFGVISRRAGRRRRARPRRDHPPGRRRARGSGSSPRLRIVGVPLASDATVRHGGGPLGRRRRCRLARHGGRPLGDRRRSSARRSSSGCPRHGTRGSDRVVVHRGTPRRPGGPHDARRRFRSRHRSARSSTSPAGSRTIDSWPRWRASSVGTSAHPSGCAARLDALRGSGRPGAGRLEALLDAARRRASARVDARRRRYGSLLSGSGLPLPARQHWVHDGRRSLSTRLRLAGAQARARVRRLGVPRRRRSRSARTASASPRSSRSGWRVLPVTWDAASDGPDASSAGSRRRSPPIHCRFTCAHASAERSESSRPAVASVHGDLADDAAVDAVEDLVEAVAGDGEAVVALADDGAASGRAPGARARRPTRRARRCRTGS